MTQEEKVLKHLEMFGTITPIEAISEYGIMRLGARIHDLRRKGICIVSERVNAKNRFGEDTYYAIYTLIKKI